ncbi:macrolide transport system ATP-binding/permease protein [Leucobacter exalbidus]|uniref:Macrolide transport system ATP-binding/permease protein n=1 Tax=Leucobacter exalbidus TaxID=662960 RepID=A0A940PRF5_9MICO|nr:ABC-F family ATP-binding cassette domain-containing protein [Leucobacter exalbidus]MBP1325302.1 macrolide transport system ATP-binding/permease protein [Leucobacter exalbidus]
MSALPPFVVPTTSSTASLHLRVDSLSVSFAARRVLTDISFTVAAGDRLGLIAENGSGKSTLLRAAAGLIEPDHGIIEIAGGDMHGAATIGLLHQTSPFAATDTVDDALEAAIARARHAVAEVDRAAAALATAPFDAAVVEAYSLALDEAERLDAWTADSRTSSMLSGLGLADLDRTRPTDELSGGQLARLSLAWLLLRAPDVLLLDEPTNHLDAAATEYLLRVITHWRGPVLFASHDRAFLDAAATSLVDLDPAPLPQQLAEERGAPGAGSGAGITKFTGSYSAYLAARTQARARWERQYRDEQLELKRLRAGVGANQQVGHAEWRPRTETRAAQKFYADRNARVVARRVNDARSRLETLEASQLRAPVTELTFAGLNVGRSGKPSERPESLHAEAPPALLSGPIVELSRAAVDGRLVPVDLSLHAGEKLLLTGPNGAGKSTLVALIAGELQPSSGGCITAPGLSIGLLSQRVRIADPQGRGAALTAQQAYSDAVGWEQAEALPLSTFGLLQAELELRPVNQLSLGQQQRLSLAIVLASPPDLLLLDEPTNHLSLTLATELEHALEGYRGAVIVASHDRWLQDRWRGIRLSLTPVSPK